MITEIGISAWSAGKSFLEGDKTASKKLPENFRKPEDSMAARDKKEKFAVPPECPHHKAANSDSLTENNPFYKDIKSDSNSKSIKPAGCSSSELNPRNMMFTDLSSEDGQYGKVMDDKQLPLKRQVSSIPKTPLNDTKNLEEAGDNWVYPSQSQFYEAMRRKNHDPKEEDMAVIVPLHNAMNEMAWKRILEWEDKYKSTCAKPTLKSFMGKPDEPSIKSRWNVLMGSTKPFDRHDWVVDRCGKEVTYVLDFYQGKSTDNSLVSVYIDARPSPKSFEAIRDRFIRWFKEQ